VTPKEIAQVQAYLRNRFNNNRIALVSPPNKDDSVEVTLPTTREA